MKQRIAGKSLPSEKFAVKKSERYFAQSGRLTLAAHELVYTWNGFSILVNRPDLLGTIINTVIIFTVYLFKYLFIYSTYMNIMKYIIKIKFTVERHSK